MSALQTTLDVLSHANRFSVKQAASKGKFQGPGPWLMSNLNGVYGLNTIIGMDAAHAAGVDPVDRTPFIVAMINSLTLSHRSQPTVWPPTPKHPAGPPNDWAKSIARAQFTALLVEMALRYWAHLSPAIQARLRVCVEYDVSRETVKWWKRPDGTCHPSMRSGDSKTEEVAWTTQLTHAAVLLGLPYETLRDEAIRAGFAVPQDGNPEGYNVDGDFEVENHMLRRADGTGVKPGDPTGTPIKPNPYYQKSALLAEERVACLSQLRGVAPPAGLYRRLPEVWDVLTQRPYTVADGWTPPGGPIYRPDGFIRFPRGSDFSDAENNAVTYSFAMTDAVVARRHPDPGQRAVALDWCERHMQTALDMQMVQKTRMGAAWDGRIAATTIGYPNQQAAMFAAFTHTALTR